MQVRELVNLGKLLKGVIKDEDLPGQYEQLVSAVNQAAQNQNPQNVQAVLDRLKAIHARAEDQILSSAQRRLMSDYGADSVLGKVAIDRLDEIFSKNQAHPQGLVTGLKAMQKDTNQLVSRVNQLIEGIEPMLSAVAGPEPSEGEGRLWLYFDNAASVNTIDDLENAAETWKEVLHHFSRMPGAAAVPGRLLQVHKSSPLELELAASVVLLAPLAMGIQWVLSRIEHVIKICQEAERLKQLKVKTKIIRDLYADADDRRKKIASEAADEIRKTFEADAEARNAVEQALKKVMTFIEGGGQLDIDIGDPSPRSEEGEESNGNASKAEIRRLIASIRKDIKLLPAAGTSGQVASREQAQGDETTD